MFLGHWSCQAELKNRALHHLTIMKSQKLKPVKQEAPSHQHKKDSTFLACKLMRTTKKKLESIIYGLKTRGSMHVLGFISHETESRGLQQHSEFHIEAPGVITRRTLFAIISKAFGRWWKHYLLFGLHVWGSN